MKAKPKPTGRPPTEISEAQWKVIEQMAKDMCTQQEIADYLGIGIRTLCGKLRQYGYAPRERNFLKAG